MQTYKIEIDEKVWNYLKSKAEPFEDTPNSVLNRLLFRSQLSEVHGINKQAAITTPPSFSDGVPKALAQILEVIYEMKKSGRNRREATNLVARRRNTAPQTVIDKYCRQLGRRAYEIDRLLEDQNLREFRALLERKFVNHRDLIDSFFNSLNTVKKVEEHHA
jgi:negative regulator of replication initiation